MKKLTLLLALFAFGIVGCAEEDTVEIDTTEETDVMDEMDAEMDEMEADMDEMADDAEEAMDEAAAETEEAMDEVEDEVDGDPSTD